MSPTLPSSLSPHICILPSPDLEQLLCTLSLPPLQDILQSFSPLPQVTTRTSTLVTVQHSSFALRFSGLSDIENACKEDEEKRAARTIDWISERINQRSSKWTEDMEEKPGRDGSRSPWWDELRRCSEGDCVPGKTEGWNHPVSIILGVSTTASNPLQAITTLHSHILEFPSWVDPTHLVYTLVVHPQGSTLSDEEAGALFNAIRKQYGLHTHLLSLSLPSPPPTPVLIPLLPPRLPPPPIDTEQNGLQILTTAAPVHPVANPQSNSIRMSENDIQQIARFTREFVLTSLIPWMEKCVVEWNDAYSSSKRLPSRLFSSTRRLFGSGASTPPPPVHTPSTSTSSLPIRSLASNTSQTSFPGSGTLLQPPSHLRRLAEFATILGDYKLATSVWESLRKEGKGGSDILPILLSPSSAVRSYAMQALSSIHPSAIELPPQAQLQALKYAVRWETGIQPNYFLSDVLEGERWLVWAAGNAEEPPSALLLAHAALLGVRKLTRRRAALWYFIAASKLQTCGIKPLAMYFLRRAHEILISKPEKLLSPSFWDSEGITPLQHVGFDGAISGIEHPLGRLLYTTGDTWGAIRVFLDLLRWSSASLPSTSRTTREIKGGQEPFTLDRIYLEDFATALSHLKSISDQEIDLSRLTLPIKFVIPASCRVRLLRDSVSGEESEWEDKEAAWRSFWKPHGRETLERGGTAAIRENFWIDVTLLNSLDTEVILTNLTLVVEAKGHDAVWVEKNVTIQRIDEIVLSAKESRAISIAISACEATTLTISHLRYHFLDLMPTNESLARRGRRLHDTLQQRLIATYAPDILIKVDVEDSSLDLSATFHTEDPLVVLDGEYKRIKVWISNAGSKPIGEIWLLADRDDQISFDVPSGSSLDAPLNILHTDNKLEQWVPHRVPLDQELRPSKRTDVLLTWRPVRKTNPRFCTLFIYRETGGGNFHCTRVSQNYKINPSLAVFARSYVIPSRPHPFLVNIKISNLAPTPLAITQISTVSPVWQCRFLDLPKIGPVQQNQFVSFLLSASPTEDRSCIDKVMTFVSRALGDVLGGREIVPESPPPLKLTCSHAFETEAEDCVPLLMPDVSHLYQAERRSAVISSIAHSHPHIPTSSYPHIFPSYNPLSLDIVAFWEIPSEKRSGFTLLSLTLGIGHGALRGIIDDFEHAKVQRSMYAETRREKMEVLQAIRDSEWNASSNPVVVSVQDGLTVEHDFDKGACLIPVTVTLRNYSLTHPSRYVLRFDPSQIKHAGAGLSNLLPPRYVGPLVIRGTLEPCESVSSQMHLWATRPGAYALVGWKVEVDVGEPCTGEGDASWRTRCHYTQGPPSNYDQWPSCIVNSVPSRMSRRG